MDYEDWLRKRADKDWLQKTADELTGEDLQSLFMRLDYLEKQNNINKIRSKNVLSAFRLLQQHRPFYDHKGTKVVTGTPDTWDEILAMYWKDEQIPLVVKMIKQITAFKVDEDKYIDNAKILIVQLEAILTAEGDYEESDSYKNMYSHLNEEDSDSFNLDLSWGKDYWIVEDDWKEVFQSWQDLEK